MLNTLPFNGEIGVYAFLVEALIHRILIGVQYNALSYKCNTVERLALSKVHSTTLARLGLRILCLHFFEHNHAIYEYAQYEHNLAKTAFN